ncbi:hypothetical protein [Treponema sp.]|uniref:hypothetical protein n=1 Tax=Treponema sp. TaxID=166 RepID=UPI0025DBFD1F|nr:hypothetical protein [Treponema sp.]MCR5218473.1 hypothetical protein [Treponema sp.]
MEENINQSDESQVEKKVESLSENESDVKVEFKTDDVENQTISESNLENSQASDSSESVRTNEAGDSEDKSDKEAEKKDSADKKKKKPFILRFIFGILKFICAILVILFVAMVVCAFHKKNVLEVIPQGFSLYVHTDSVWEAVEPLAELDAADLLFSDPEFADFREPFMEFRSNEWRKSPFLSFIASRKADVALYPNEKGEFDFLAVVDLSYLSLATRLVEPALSFIDVEGVTLNKETGLIEYCDPSSVNADGTRKEEDVIYIKPMRNLVLVAQKEELLIKAVASDNNNYSAKEAELMTGKSSDAIKLLVDSRKFADQAVENSPMLSRLSSVISNDSLTEVSLSITNDNIKLKAKLPLSKENVDSAALAKIINRDSKEPKLLSKLTENVQYYTILNAGSLAELKDVAFSYIPKSEKADELWATGNKLSRTVFGLSLEEMIFSWTGGEFAALGLENQNDPVFVIKIEDENQRGIVFDKFISSIVIEEDSSLILDGMRMRRIMLPGFLQDIIALFDVNIPRPYYMVKDGYIYFSENPETLAGINGASKKELYLTDSEVYNSVIGSTGDKNTIDLYYNLERSIPFFLRSNAGLAKILQLYSNGRFTLGLHGDNVEVQVEAVSKHIIDLHCVPGFPVSLEGKADGILEKSGSTIFWLENSRNIKSMGIPSTKTYTYKSDDKLYIKAGSESLKKGGCLWVVSDRGKVTLLDSKLKEVFVPVNIESRPASGPACTKDKVVIPTVDGNLVFVDKKGNVTSKALNLTGSLKSAPVVLGDTIAVYDKSFMGSIILLKENSSEEKRLNVSSIGFESPALMKKDKDIYTAFVTQNGQAFVWKNDKIVTGFPLKLDGVFFKNFVTDGKYFYALSYGSILYRVGIDGSVLSVKVPCESAKDGFISAGKNIYVTPDSNVIYGFDSNLEMLYGYPLLGWGKPAFADVNGDNKDECFVLTVDKKLYAWNIK